MSKQYHIFISHAWKYDAAYTTLVKWINDSGLNWSNYSVPYHDPIDAKNTKKLKEALTRQINPSSVVIIISGMYAVYSDWIDYEIDEAVRLNKKIIGVKPWGQERVPKKIQDNATKMVGWNSSSVVSAVKELG